MVSEQIKPLKKAPFVNLEMKEMGIGWCEGLQLVDQAAKFNFKSKFEPLPVVWQSVQKAIPEGNRRFHCKIMAEIFGQQSCTACVAQTGKHKQIVFPSRRQ